MRAVALISGRGSNLRAILESRPLDVVAVVSNVSDVQGLTIAASFGIATQVVDHRNRTRQDFDAALQQAIDEYAPDLVILAGFMRILTDAFVDHYHGRMVNIHPSLLPAFRGVNTHAAALTAGVKIHGCTVHYVTRELDGGPIIAQAAVPVLRDDSEATLAARVLRQEHRLYPQVLTWIAGGHVWLDQAGKVNFANEAVSDDVLISPKGIK